jgi:FKBP-type peptidyl-prolyl cis-trans isomerase 2
MKVAANHTVRIDYELRVKGGEVLESSERSGPLEYVHGEHKLLPALERQIEGMAVGEEKRGELPAGEAFGDAASLPPRELPRAEFPKGEDLTVGRIFEANAGEGQSVRFQIAAVEAETVKVRFLHPLAEKDIEFRVKVLGIQPPGARRSVLRPPPPPAQALGIEVAADEEPEK